MDLTAFIENFTPDAWTSLLVVVCLLTVLVFTSLPPDMVFVGALGLLLLFGVLEPDAALAGFGSQGLVTVGALYVVVAGLQEAGGLRYLSKILLRKPGSPAAARLKLMLPVGAMSAFLNNTPVVAMFIPVVSDWCRRHGLAPSRFLIPLSYASILGGMCTLVGTSTNLVVNGLYVERYGGAGIGMFEVAMLGLPCALLGVFWMVVAGERVLPERGGAREVLESEREYTVELLLEANAPSLGKPVGQSDLAEIPDGRLVEVSRDGQSISPVSPEELLLAGDRLLFAGSLDAIRALLQLRGVRLASDEEFVLARHPGDRRLVEAVVSHTCPLVGSTIRGGRFRQLYNAVVIAMARNGERLKGGLSDVPLRAGDVLLIESHAGFIPRQRDSGDFYLLHTVDEEGLPTAPTRAWVSFLILAAMVGLVALGTLSMLKASMLAAGLMLLTGCCGASRARRRIEWNVLMVIGAALGIGRALEVSGAAGALAELLMGLSGGSPWFALALVYLNTVLFTEIITNNAAVALLFPVAMGTAERLGVNPQPFLFCLMIAGSASFATPIGYQTNLMVYGAGGYRFTDYFRAGIPLSLLVGTTAILLAPLIWNF